MCEVPAHKASAAFDSLEILFNFMSVNYLEKHLSQTQHEPFANFFSITTFSLLFNVLRDIEQPTPMES